MHLWLRFWLLWTLIRDALSLSLIWYSSAFFCFRYQSTQYLYTDCFYQQRPSWANPVRKVFLEDLLWIPNDQVWKLSEMSMCIGAYQKLPGAKGNTLIWYWKLWKRFHQNVFLPYIWTLFAYHNKFGTWHHPFFLASSLSLLLWVIVVLVTVHKQESIIILKDSLILWWVVGKP